MNITLSKQPQQLQQHSMLIGGGGGGGGSVGGGDGGGGGGGNRIVMRKPGSHPGGKLMRLRCRFRPLHETYLVNNDIAEKDSDVVFLCLDGRVRAHKIILASCSDFFGNLFDGQLPGLMTNVLVPDIPVATVRLILSLAYNDAIQLTQQQMKDSSPYLKLFGFPPKLFSFNGNPLRGGGGGGPGQGNAAMRAAASGGGGGGPITTIPINTGTGVGSSGGKVRIVNQSGQLISKGGGGGGPVGKIGPTGAVTVTASSIYREIKSNQQQAIQQRQHQQQLAAAAQRPRVDAAAAEAEDGEYKFQLQGYEHQQLQKPQKMIIQQQQQQQRILNPQLRKIVSGQMPSTSSAAAAASGSSSSTTQQQQQQQRKGSLLKRHPIFGPGMTCSIFRRIAPKPTPTAAAIPTVVENFPQPEVHMETEEQGEDEQPQDSERRKQIQEWMRNVGRDDLAQVIGGGGGLRSSGESGSGGGDPPKNQCMICNNVFDSEEKWLWHEAHHVGLGLYKCTFCEELFSTSIKVYQHEMMEHGVTSGVGATDSPPAIPSDFQIIQGRKRRPPIDDECEIVQPLQQGMGDDDPPKMTLVRTIHGSHNRRLPGTAGGGPIMISRSTKKFLAASASGSPQLQQKYAKYARLARNFKARNPLIRIAKTEAEDITEGSRKVKKLHWLYVCSKCEHASDSSAKAQQHYHRCYATAGAGGGAGGGGGGGGAPSFESCVVKYRRGFFGKFKCPLCPKRYTSIGGFTIHCGHTHHDYILKFTHRHEDDTICCIICKKKWKDPAEFQAHLSDDGDCTGTPVFGPEDGAYSSNEWIGNGTPGEVQTPPPKINRANLGTLSRSTRLANRILLTPQDESTFNSVDCPLCGTTEIPKIVDHIQAEHGDLNLKISRVADTTLRCQKCQISFAVCDLLAHHSSCTGCKEFNFGGRSRSRASAGPAVPMPIPEGVGCSPIDTIECTDLSSLDTLRKALKCNVCQRTASKLGTIAECYRTHGIVRCALCFNTYNDKSSYSIHLKATHAGQVANKLSCPLCHKEFTNVGQTAGHMYNNHWLTLLGNGQVARKGPRKFLPNLINLEQLEDAAASEAAAATTTTTTTTTTDLDTTNDDEEGLDSTVDDGDGSGSGATEDYSNITLRSLLESSTSPSQSQSASLAPKSAAAAAAAVVVTVTSAPAAGGSDETKEKTTTTSTEGKRGSLEGLLSEAAGEPSKKPTANAVGKAAAASDVGGEDDEEEEDDEEMVIDEDGQQQTGKLGGDEELGEEEDEGEYEDDREGVEEEEDDGLVVGEDDVEMVRDDDDSNAQEHQEGEEEEEEEGEEEDADDEGMELTPE